MKVHVQNGAQNKNDDNKVTSEQCESDKYKVTISRVTK